MPWPTGTSTAGLRVASNGVLPPKPIPEPPPPPERYITDETTGGRISTAKVTRQGIDIALASGSTLRMPFTLVGPEDIARVTVSADASNIALFLRNGTKLDYSLARIKALARTLEERELEDSESTPEPPPVEE